MSEVTDREIIMRNPILDSFMERLPIVRRVVCIQGRDWHVNASQGHIHVFAINDRNTSLTLQRYEWGTHLNHTFHLYSDVKSNDEKAISVLYMAIASLTISTGVYLVS